MSSNDKDSDFDDDINTDIYAEAVSDDLLMIDNEDPVSAKKKSNLNVRRRIEDLQDVKRLLKDFDNYEDDRDILAQKAEILSLLSEGE